MSEEDAEQFCKSFAVIHANTDQFRRCPPICTPDVVGALNNGLDELITQYGLDKVVDWCLSGLEILYPTETHTATTERVIGQIH